MLLIIIKQQQKLQYGGGDGTEDNPWCIPLNYDYDVKAKISEDGVLTIYGTGKMKDWSSSNSNGKWHGYVDLDNIKKIVIEDGIENIGNYAFACCKKLESVEISNSVKTIGKWAFNQCNSLTNIVISSNVDNIQTHAFDDCKILKSIDVSLSNMKYTSLDGVLFNKDKTKLIQYPSGKVDKEYTIPNGVKILSESCFARSRNLRLINIPACLETIDYDALYNCDDLENIVVDTENEKYSSENGVLFSKDKTVLIQYPTGKTGDKYIIPNGVKIIGDDAFAKSSLKDIEIPNSVTDINSGAFYGCVNLEQLDIPSSVEKIDDSAFWGCKNLSISKYYCYKGIPNYADVEIIHYYITETKKATLNEDGYYIHKCRCGRNILEQRTIYHPQTIELSQNRFIYDKKKKEPYVIVIDNNGNVINSSNYSVNYAQGRKNIGEYNVEVKFNGDYSGIKLLKFRILPKGTKILKAKGAKKKISVSWKKQTKKTTGYQIQYSTNKNFRKNNKKINVNKNKTTTKDLLKLKRKKKYYIRIRTYKKVNGKKIYSDWSKVKKVKTK